MNMGSYRSVQLEFAQKRIEMSSLDLWWLGRGSCATVFRGNEVVNAALVQVEAINFYVWEKFLLNGREGRKR